MKIAIQCQPSLEAAVEVKRAKGDITCLCDCDSRVQSNSTSNFQPSSNIFFSTSHAHFRYLDVVSVRWNYRNTSTYNCCFNCWWSVFFHSLSCAWNWFGCEEVKPVGERMWSSYKSIYDFSDLAWVELCVKCEKVALASERERDLMNVQGSRHFKISQK